MSVPLPTRRTLVFIIVLAVLSFPTICVCLALFTTNFPSVHTIISGMIKQIEDKRIAEKHLVETMVIIYCKGNHHPPEAPCPECHALIDYAHARVDACTHMENKTFCSACETPCYRPVMRERIRAAMKYAGPRMMFSHPILALKHLLSGKR